MNLIDQLRSCVNDRPMQRRRVLRASRYSCDRQVEIEGQTLLDFASNDYLGLAEDRRLIERAMERTAQLGCGTRASRLVCGNDPWLPELEQQVADLKGTSHSLIMGSGFQTMSSVLAALVDRRLATYASGIPPLVFTDRLCHASCHFGLVGRVRQHRFRHNDLDHLRQLLEKYDARNCPSLIVTESVFSMDGDLLDVDAVRELAREFGCILFVDEAHATGVFGENGMGRLCDGSLGEQEIVAGTFSKGLGSYGAYIACGEVVYDYLVNHCAGLIYSTALPPAVLGSIEAAIELLPDLAERRELVSQYADLVRHRLNDMGFDTGDSASPIIPVMMGSDESAIQAGEHMRRAGMLTGVIRPPTVPDGTARLRLSLSASHTSDHIEQLVSAFSEWRETGVGQ